MNDLLPVMLGGAIGAGARHAVGTATTAVLGSGYPWGTLAVNLIGGLLMGVLAGWLTRSGGNETLRLLVGVGVLGGFTTFSAFSLDLALMLVRGQAPLALGYALASVVGAVVATGLGIVMVRLA